ncbi:hypothetical protein SNEBB_009621 [Seison nebaliae]|nr:hypothetical protein SNEBB_009621 [Seison nebaliae]
MIDYEIYFLNKNFSHYFERFNLICNLNKVPERYRSEILFSHLSAAAMQFVLRKCKTISFVETYTSFVNKLFKVLPNNPIEKVNQSFYNTKQTNSENEMEYLSRLFHLSNRLLYSQINANINMEIFKQFIFGMNNKYLRSTIIDSNVRDLESLEQFLDKQPRRTRSKIRRMITSPIESTHGMFKRSTSRLREFARSRSRTKSPKPNIRRVVDENYSNKIISDDKKNGWILPDSTKSFS